MQNVSQIDWFPGRSDGFRRGECPAMDLYPVSNRADNFSHRGSFNDRLQLAQGVDLIERKSRMCLLFYVREEIVSQWGGVKSW